MHHFIQSSSYIDVYDLELSTSDFDSYLHDILCLNNYIVYYTNNLYLKHVQ